MAVNWLEERDPDGWVVHLGKDDRFHARPVMIDGELGDNDGNEVYYRINEKGQRVHPFVPIIGEPDFMDEASAKAEAARLNGD